MFIDMLWQDSTRWRYVAIRDNNDWVRQQWRGYNTTTLMNAPRRLRWGIGTTCLSLLPGRRLPKQSQTSYSDINYRGHIM